jgi:hypothetical protein
MANEKIVKELASHYFSNSKELKNQAIAIKKIVGGIERQQKRLAKYLKPAETAALSKAAGILASYAPIFVKASKEREKQANEKAAKWEKEIMGRIENMVIKDFGSLTPANLLAECKIFKDYLKLIGHYARALEDVISHYEKNNTASNLQTMKLRLAHELEELNFGLKTAAQGFETFKLNKRSQ